MKTMRKVLSVLLVLAMVLSLGAMAVSAAGTGTITVNDPEDGHTYKLYKVFDLTYDANDPKKVAYTYTAAAGTDDFLTALQGQNSPFTVTETTEAGVYNVVKKDTVGEKDVFDFLNTNVPQHLQVTAEQKFDKSTGTTLVFNNLDYGYYYMTSTVGTLVTINSAKPDATVTDKNEVPTVDKTVNSQNKNSASVGDTLDFSIVITKKDGAENYVLTDKLHEGLTLKSETIAVHVNGKPLTADNEYTLEYDTNTDPQKFTVKLKNEYLATLDKNTEIEVSYQAVLNEKAVVGEDPVTNEAILNYGNDPDLTTTPSSVTKTYTHGFDLKKTDAQGATLDGAEFKLYTDAQKQNPVNLKLDNETIPGTPFYRPVKEGEVAAEKIEVTNGQVRIDGLAYGIYYLEETKAPAGYNKLTYLVKVELAPDPDGAEGSVLVKVYDEKGENPQVMTDGIVTVVNNAGSLLPSTGGMGTTMFYVLGAVLVLGAAIALVAKRRVREQ